MRFLPLIWKNLLRRKIRTLFTLLSIIVAFVLFCYLAAVRLAFGLGIDVAGADRLMLIHKVSFIQLLPESYEARIEAVDGVTAATHATWFGGIYQDPQNFFSQNAVDPEPFLDMYPEYVLTASERENWLRNQTGAIVGRALADRYGWQVGDRVPLQGTIWRTPDDSPWEFTLDGIYEGAEPETDTGQFFFHYEYLSDTLEPGLVGWYMIRVDEPARADEIALAIDERFANSPYETKTSTERAFVQAFANQIGNIGKLITAILVAVLFTILLVTANTMAQSIRERTNELAVLKTLGFSNVGVLLLVLTEAMVLAGVGGAIGLGVGNLLISLGDPSGGFLPAFFVPARDLVGGCTLVILLGLTSGIFPAVQATRLRIVDALRRA